MPTKYRKYRQFDKKLKEIAVLEYEILEYANISWAGSGTVDTVDFQDFALINSIFFYLRASSSRYMNTKIIKFGWEILFYE